MITLGAYLIDNRLQRCGVIPYTILDGRIYYLLARHAKTRELGDFGGHIERNETSLEGALREFFEESRGIFDRSVYDPKHTVIYVALVEPENMAILFVYVHPEWMLHSSRCFSDTRYNQEFDRKEFQEISDIVWMEEDEFSRIVRGKNPGQIMWKKIHSFLRKHHDISFTNTLRSCISW